MFDNQIFLLGISTLFAAVPAIIWLYLIFNKKEKSKKTVIFIFLLGTLTAPALLGLQYAWDIFPQFNLAAFIEDNIQTQTKMFIAMFVLFGALEEVIKHYVITIVDKKTVLVKTIGDAIRYSLAAALGFSFSENVYYLFQFWPSITTGELVGMYIFRSIFTACAHMIFSGIFGYFYGIGKFSIEIVKQNKLVGKVSRISKVVSKIFNLPLAHAHQQHMVIKGLLIAVVLHAVYNFLLQFNQVLPVIVFVILGFLYMKYLLNRKTGHLVLITDISEKTKSTMAKKDEDVVVELLGMWFQQEKYVDVMHICERLLKRDPDNNVVKLFQAKAMDKMDNKNTYKKILGTVLKPRKEEDGKNIIEKSTSNKELMAKVVKEKETKINSPQVKKVENKKGTFKLDV